MKELFVPNKQALALRELGFDEPCLSYYFSDGTFNDAAEEDDTLYPGDPRFHSDTNSSLSKHLKDELKYNSVSAPLYSQAFSFFREKYNLYPSIISHDTDNHMFTIVGESLYESDDEQDNFYTHGKAELACIKKLIEIVEQSKSE
jgi:hypothetical protein